MSDSAKNKARRTVAWLLALCVLLVGSSAAFAKKRVVVLNFTGPQGPKAAAAVASAVKKRHTVVSSAQYTKAEKKLKAKKQTDKNVARIASEIQVDAVIVGVVKKVKGKFTLTVSVREGTSGRVKGSAKIAMRGPKIDQKAKDDIEEQVVPLVDEVESISSNGGGNDFGGGDSTPAEKPRKGKKPVEDESASADSGMGGSGTGSSEDTGEQEAAPGVDDEKNKQTASSESGEASAESSVSASAGSGEEPAGEIVGGKYARNGAFSVDLGVSMFARTLTFTTRASLAANQQPNGYDGSIVPGGMVDGEVYPMALLGSKPDSAVAGIGLTFVFDRVFVLKSKYGTEEYNTTQQRYGVGLRYRLNIGHKPTLPTFFVGIGYNNLSFVIDSGAAVIGLPDVNYTYLDPNIGFRLPLGSDKLALLADARYLLILGSGEFTEKQNYGSGSTVGVDFDGGLEYRLMPRLPIRAGVHYVRIAYDFDGSGTLANNLDMDPSTPDVGGALDEYLGGYVTAGYIF